MICPGCNRQIRQAPPNRFQINSTQEHIWGPCPHCKEIVHFIYRENENFLYGWIESKEATYVQGFEALRQKKNILYVQANVPESSFLKICREFASSHGWNVGFVTVPGLARKASVLNSVHPTIALDEVLFPENPSFLAEKIITENIPGNLFSTNKTLFDRFEIYD